MTWNLFIDDERIPADVTWAPDDMRKKYKKEPWVIARTVVHAAIYMKYYKCLPSFISFDHDLGEGELTGYDLVKILVDDALDFPDDPEFQFPTGFNFYVHSMNPIGKKNIEGLLNNYLEHKNSC